MIIYLDESKKLWEWEIVFWGFITKHNTNYINKYVLKKKIEYWFKNIELELKWAENSWNIFYEKMIKDKKFHIISNNILWITIKWYYKDDKDWYINILSILISKIYNALINYNKDITIIADNVRLWKNIRKVELEIEQALNKNFPLQNKHKFNFANSKSFWWLQIADIISYELRQVNINKIKDFDGFISNNTFNINLREIIEI